MKQTLNQVLAVILIGSFLATSCKKDETTPANSFKYNDKVSEIGSAIAGNLGNVSDGAYGYSVIFLEKTLTIHSSKSSIDSLSGIGDVLNIAMVSSDSDGIKPGVYNYSSSQTSYDPFTFGYESGLIVNFNSLLENGSSILDINGGKITVAKNDKVYEFTLSLTTTSNSKITGFYKGEIVVYQFGKKKSVAKNPFSYPLFN